MKSTRLRLFLIIILLIAVPAFFPAPRSAVFASGAEPVDALLAGAYGGRRRSPLLPVAADSVPRAVVRYLRSHREDMRNSLLVADPRAVSESAFGDLEELLKVR